MRDAFHDTSQRVVVVEKAKSLVFVYEQPSLDTFLCLSSPLPCGSGGGGRGAYWSRIRKSMGSPHGIGFFPYCKVFLIRAEVIHLTDIRSFHTV